MYAGGVLDPELKEAYTDFESATALELLKWLMLLRLRRLHPGLSSSSFIDCDEEGFDDDFFFFKEDWLKREFKKLASRPPGELGCRGLEILFFSFVCLFSLGMR